MAMLTDDGALRLWFTYWGPGLAGKSTNLQWLHDHHVWAERPWIHWWDSHVWDVARKLEATSQWKWRDARVVVNAVTFPGGCQIGESRRGGLQFPDAIAFVADSHPARLQANVESLQKLREALLEEDCRLETMPPGKPCCSTRRDIPWVVQWNKRDWPDASPVEELTRTVLVDNEPPSHPAVAFRGEGVDATLDSLVTQALAHLDRHGAPPATDASDRLVTSSRRLPGRPDRRGRSAHARCELVVS